MLIQSSNAYQVKLNYIHSINIKHFTTLFRCTTLFRITLLDSMKAIEKPIIPLEGVLCSKRLTCPQLNCAHTVILTTEINKTSVALEHGMPNNFCYTFQQEQIKHRQKLMKKYTIWHYKCKEYR